MLAYISWEIQKKIFAQKQIPKHVFFAPDFMPEIIKFSSRCFQKFQFNLVAFWLDSPDFL